MMRRGGKLKYKHLCQAFLSASSRSAKKKQEKEKKSLILRLSIFDILFYSPKTRSQVGELVNYTAISILLDLIICR